MEKYKWSEVPVRIARQGKIPVVPANEVESGDVIWDANGVSYITDGFWPDDEEEIAYLAINNGLYHWPAGFFVGE